MSKEKIDLKNFNLTPKELLVLIRIMTPSIVKVKK